MGPWRQQCQAFGALQTKLRILKNDSRLQVILSRGFLPRRKPLGVPLYFRQIKRAPVNSMACGNPASTRAAHPIPARTHRAVQLSQSKQAEGNRPPALPPAQRRAGQATRQAPPFPTDSPAR